jgi:hypothetical protein
MAEFLDFCCEAVRDLVELVLISSAVAAIMLLVMTYLGG